MSLPNEFTVYGSEEMLKPLILQLLAQHYDQGGEGVGGGGGHQRLPTKVNGECFVSLRFAGKTQQNKDHWVEKSFRWVKYNPRTVPPETIIALGYAIRNKFDNFSFTTGRKTYTYNRFDQGFNRVWGYFKDDNEAKRVFEQMLDLQAFSPDWTRLTESRVVDEGDRFQSPAEKIPQAGVSIRPDEERPIAIVKFTSATFKFPHIRDVGLLVDQHGNVMDVRKFLAQYQD